MTHIQIARPVLKAEVGRVHHIVPRGLRALVGVPVHRMRVSIVRVQAQPVAAIAFDLEHRRLVCRVGPAHDLGNLLVVRVDAPGNSGFCRPGSVKGNRDLRGFDRALARVAARTVVEARWSLVAHVVGDGLGRRGQVEICVNGNRQPSPQADHRAGGHLYVARQRFFDCDDTLVNLRVAEVWRKLHSSRLDDAPRARWPQHVWKRRSAAGIQIVGGPHEEVQISIQGAGLSERRLHRQIVGAPKVQSIAQPQHRPMRFAVAHSHTHPRTPVVAQARQLLCRRKNRIVQRSQRRRQLLPLPAQPA